MKSDKNFKFLFLNLLIVVLFAFIPLVWFKDNLLIVTEEYWLLDPSAFTSFLKYAWNIKLFNAGGLSQSIPQLIPVTYFWTFIKSLGLSLVVIERLWIILLFLLPGLSAYYLMSVIYNREWAKLISSALYMFNLYIIQVGPFHSNVKLILITLPLILAFWIKGLNNKERFLKYAVLIGLCSLIYTESNVNPPTVAIIPIVLFLYLIFYIVTHKKTLYYSLKFTLVTISFYFLLNLWWLATFLLYVFQQSKFIHRVHTFAALDTGGVIEFFRLLGFWGWKSGCCQMPYFPYAHFYNEPFLLILSYSIPLLAFLAIILRPKNKNILFFSLLAIIGIFLAKGTAVPFGFLYEWAYKNIPGFWIFREPFAKFTPITLLSYSVLLGFSVDSIYQKAKNWQRLKREKHKLFLSNLIPISAIVIILIVSYPLLTGQVIWDYWNGSMRSNYVKVPNYWHQARGWLDHNDREARVFQSPKGGYNVPYRWKHGFTASDAPAVVLLSNPILRSVSFPISDTDRITNSIYEFFNPNKRQKFIQLLVLLNTKYILQQNDLDWKFAYEDTYSPEQMKKILSSQQGVIFIKSFGKLDLYKISDDYFLPHIYPSASTAIIYNDLNTMVKIIEANSSDKLPLFIEREHLKLTNLDRLNPGKTPPTITFRKINPTKYEVKVENATKPFFLVFSESYHPKWKAYVETEDRGQRTEGRKQRTEDGKRETENGKQKTGNGKWEMGNGKWEVGSGKWGIIAEYPRVHVKEARHEMRFTPKDVSYLFKKPLLEKYHLLVNGYANAWYIDPKEIGSSNFTITLYFWPQSLFYLGLMISGSTFIGCTIYLGYSGLRKKKVTRNL